MKNEPIRLLEDPQLSAAERALLEAGRTVAPVHYDVAAGAVRFHAAIAGAGAAAGAAGAAAIGKTATLIKLGIVFAATLALGAAYYYASAAFQRPAAPASPPAAVPEAVKVAPSPPPRASAPPPVAVKPPPSPSSSAARSTRHRVTSARRSSAPVAQPAAVRSSAGSADGAARAPATSDNAPAEPLPAHAAEGEQASAKQVPAPADKPAESFDELKNMARARALVARDPRAALDLLRHIERAHPHGYFVEERNALTILALVGVGQRDAASLRAEKFLRAHPRSPFADRIREALEP